MKCRPARGTGHMSLTNSIMDGKVALHGEVVSLHRAAHFSQGLEKLVEEMGRPQNSPTPGWSPEMNDWLRAARYLAPSTDALSTKPGHSLASSETLHTFLLHPSLIKNHTRGLYEKGNYSLSS